MALTYTDILALAQSQFRQHPQWHRLEGTSWENDAPVKAANLANELLHGDEKGAAHFKALWDSECKRVEELMAWQPIETAPKSTSEDTPHGKNVRAVFLLGYCPDKSAIDKLGCIDAIWWEPNENGGKGCWFGAGGFEVRPTHWMQLPQPPVIQKAKG